MSADRSVVALRGWERRREREERCAQNIPAELLALWEEVKGSSRGGTPHERYEAFLQYATDHPAEAMAALQGQADADLEAQLAARSAQEASGIPARGKPRLVFYRGQLHRITKLAHALGLGGGTLGQRINRGWPEERWTEPPAPQRRSAS